MIKNCFLTEPQGMILDRIYYQFNQIIFMYINLYSEKIDHEMYVGMAR